MKKKTGKIGEYLWVDLLGNTNQVSLNTQGRNDIPTPYAI